MSIPEPDPKAKQVRCAFVPITLIQSYAFGTLNGCQTRALLCVMSYANKKRIARPTIETIARDTNMSERSAKRAMKSLREMGFVERKTKGNQYAATVYRIVDDPSKWGVQVQGSSPATPDNGPKTPVQVTPRNTCKVPDLSPAKVANGLESPVQVQGSSPQQGYSAQERGSGVEPIGANDLDEADREAYLSALAESDNPKARRTKTSGWPKSVNEPRPGLRIVRPEEEDGIKLRA